MKKLPLYFLSATLTLMLAACGGGPAPTDATGGNVVIPLPTSATATLTINVGGVAGAPVKVTDSAGAVKFEGTVAGSKSLPDLPRGTYTVTAGAVTNFTAPGAQTADLSAGNGAVTLTYVALPGTTLNANAVSGVIPGWTSGKASAVLAHVFTFASNGQYSRSTGLVSPAGTVAADGTLNISLPNSLDASYISALFPANVSCTFTGTATDPTFQSDWYLNKLIQIGDSPLGKVQEVVSGSPVDNRHIVERVYVPADVTVKGTYSCNPGTVDAFTDTYDLTLSKGWNAVELVKNSDTEYQYRMLAADSRVELRYESFGPTVKVTLNNSSVQLKRGERVTTGASITQVGGYSGTVSLSTNVPGVTVEPTTLTLNPVTAQSLLAQVSNDPRSMRRQEEAQSVGAASVSIPLTFVAGADAPEHRYVSGDLLQVKDASGAPLADVPLSVVVTVPSVTAYLNYGGGVALDRGQTLSVPVNFYSNNGYSGPVTISLENLPDGVSATTVQTDTGAGTSPSISITTTSAAATGTKSAQLVVNAGGVITKSDVQVTVNKPSVSVNVGNYNYGNVTVRRGQTQSLSVQVASQHGFSGSTTVSLSGLPSGVTAPPLTVNVMPGTITSATLAMTASDSAAYGTTAVQVTDTDLDTSSQAQFSLSVASNLTVMPSDAVRIATAGSGLWTMSGNGQFVYSGNTYGYNYTFKRYEGNQLKASTTFFIDGSTGTTLLTTTTGELVVAAGRSIYIIKADGTTASVDFASNTAYYPKVIDAQNRLWYASYNAGNALTLNTLDLSTGTKAVVSGITPSDTYFNIYRGAAGNTLYLAPNYSSNLVITQIDAVTSTKTRDIILPGVSSVVSLAIAQDGTIWGIPSYSSIFRVNADGTLTSFPSLRSSSKLVFDAADPKVLWSYSDSTVYKIDTTSGTAAPVPVGGSATDIAADSGGGVWVSGSEYNYSSGSSAYYLSLIK